MSPAKNGKHLPQQRHLLIEARKACKWTQQELADKVDTTTVNISRWENGATFPSPHFRLELARVFGKSLEELELIPPTNHTPPSDESDPESPQASLTSVELNSKPPRNTKIVHIPPLRNQLFTGREDLLALLHERLSTAKAVALTQSPMQHQTLYGLGGIGKTQTALEYAHRHTGEYSHVFWITAATADSLRADFLELARQLSLPEMKQLTHSEPDEQQQHQIITAVKRWLATHDGWLLILDNADDLPQTQAFLPSNHKGSVLFTTRAQATGRMAVTTIEVEHMHLQDGMLLLLRWTKRLSVDQPLEQARFADLDAARRIVTEMDGLPLAIVQAAAYVDETGCRLTDYLDLYATHRKDLLARSSPHNPDSPHTVATTWNISFQQVEQRSPAAAELLCVFAFLAPDIIPEEMLKRGAAELGPRLSATVADTWQFNEALEVLRRYSLVRRNSNLGILSIHRLVQVVQRESMHKEEQHLWAKRTIRALNAAFPDANYGTDSNHQSYLLHIQECATFIEHYHLYFPEAAQLLYRAGAFLYFYGFYPQSQTLHEQALAIRQKLFGAKHADVAESLNDLAMLARHQGDYQQAEKLYQEALAIRQELFGQEHYTTVHSLNNLGVLYLKQGLYQQAKPYLEQAARITREKSLGSQHHEMLVIFINLAQLYLEQHKYEEAELRLQQAYHSSKAIVGTEHPVIIQVIILQAKLAHAQGDDESAEKLWLQSLAITEKTLGPDHPTATDRLSDLAKLYVAQRRYTQALSFCQRALNICEKTLGPEHPETISNRQHLALILRKIEEEQNDHHSTSPQ